MHSSLQNDLARANAQQAQRQADQRRFDRPSTSRFARLRLPRRFARR